MPHETHFLHNNLIFSDEQSAAQEAKDVYTLHTLLFGEEGITDTSREHKKIQITQHITQQVKALFRGAQNARNTNNDDSNTFKDAGNSSIELPQFLLEVKASAVTGAGNGGA